MTVLTKDIIAGLQTKQGGWKRDDLAQLGVPWPPPKGWKRRLERENTPVQVLFPDPLVEHIRKQHRDW